MGDGRRGRLTPLPKRENLLALINEACVSGARLCPALAEVNLSLRTYRRWFTLGQVQADLRPTAMRPAPKNKLNDEERQQIIDVCNQKEYASLPPSQIVPTMLDQGRYIAAVSTFYRVLKQANQLHHRGRSKVTRTVKPPTTYTAEKANEVWSWDITYMASRVKGRYFYLYMIEDIYSRKIVGYEVHSEECGVKAADLLQRSSWSEKIGNQPLVLHSDNGAPMKSVTLKAKMEEMGVTPSYNRPRVSNDNPYSESTFRTLKYRPNWPSHGFNSLEETRTWTQNFVNWYNNEHKHSRIRFVTPAERHAGIDGEILRQRKEVLEAAKSRNPLRWSKGVQNCTPIGSVTLNPDKTDLKAA